jgi:hypothetical protein
MHGQLEGRRKLPVEMKLGEGRDAAHGFQVKITVKMLVYVVYYPLQPGAVILKRSVHRPSMAVHLVANGHNLLDRSCGFPPDSDDMIELWP